MKRSVCFILVVLGIVALTGHTFADIGENFAPAGIEIYGDLYLSYEAGWVFWEFNEPQYLEIGLRPGIAIFFAQNLSFFVSPQFYYYKDLPLDSSFWEFVISSGIAYYFVRDPSATTGFVPSIGVGLRFEFEKDEDFFIGLAPRLRLLYFLTDRIAPYVLLEPYFTFQNFSGTDFSIEDTYLTVRTYVGMSFYFPSRDYVLVAK